MTEDFFFGWLTGFGGILLGWFLAELSFWLRLIRETKKIRLLEKVMPSMLELNQRAGLVK